MSQIVLFLNQPYPWFYRGKNLLRFTGTIFVMALGFNFLFEPFNVYPPEHKFNYLGVCLIQAFIAAIITFGVLGCTGLLINDAKWKVKKEFALIFSLFLLIGTGIFLARDIVYNNPDNFSVKYFFEEIRNTLLVGTLFFMFIIPVNYFRLERKHSQKARAIKLPGSDMLKTTEKKVRVVTQSRQDNFDLNPDNFVFAKSEGNYLELYITNNGKLERAVKRLTVKELERQLSAFEFIIKTHRSYIVNINKITHVTGNAQGYILSTKYSPEKLPVARSMIPVFNARFHFSP